MYFKNQRQYFALDSSVAQRVALPDKSLQYKEVTIWCMIDLDFSGVYLKTFISLWSPTIPYCSGTTLQHIYIYFAKYQLPGLQTWGLKHDSVTLELRSYWKSVKMR